MAISHTEIASSSTPTTAPAAVVTNIDKVLTGETTLKLESMAGVRVGDFVSGAGIPSGYVVKSHVVGNTSLSVDPSTDSVTIAPITETYTVAIPAAGLPVNSSVTIGGRTVTAGANAFTAAQLATAVSTGATAVAAGTVTGTLSSAWSIDANGSNLTITAHCLEM
jgi:hypothetical protein